MSKHFAWRSSAKDYNELLVDLVGGIVRQAIWDYFELGSYVKKNRHKYNSLKGKKEGRAFCSAYEEDKWSYQDAKEFLFTARMEELIGYNMADYIRRGITGKVDVYRSIQEPEKIIWSIRPEERIKDGGYNFNGSNNRQEW